MARVTVEDCVTIVPNRFELVLLGAQRARDIAAGFPITIDRDNDKNSVVALREISNQSIDLSEVRNHIVGGVNRHADINEEDNDLLALASDDETTKTEDASSESEEVSFEEVEVEAKDEEAVAETEEVSLDEMIEQEQAEDVAEAMESEDE